MAMSGSSHHPLRIKPVRKINRRKASGLNGNLALLLSLSISPPPAPAPFLPAPPSRAEAFCPSPAPRLASLTPRAAGSSRGAAGAGPALWGRRCGAAGAGPGQRGPALRSRRAAPRSRAGAAEPPAAALPRPAPPPRRQPAPLRSSGGSGATGMRRGAGPRWLLLAALLGTLCCAAAGGGRRRAASLGEMLREVEALMEDTQYKLRNAVQEMEAEEEGAKKLSEVNFENLPPNYHNESNTETRIGNKTVQTHQEIDKVTDNNTGTTVFSETVITSVKDGENKRNHHCSRDVECCGDQLCVWGECRKSTSKGENGTICENQHDCNPGMCCAFQKELLFPVCTPLPEEGEPCHDPSNRLLNLITWELEPDGVLERCPCASGLICQPQSHSTTSVCELSANETRNNEKEDPLTMDEMPFLSLIPRDILSDYEESSVIQEVRKELESLEDQAGLKPEPDSARDLFLGDEI
uniref:Dickkopf-related protein 3 n=1 Tax=Accipiter nisus TaxID=211598 RepID=A0A8B9M8F6_9AVES